MRFEKSDYLAILGSAAAGAAPMWIVHQIIQTRAFGKTLLLSLVLNALVFFVLPLVAVLIGKYSAEKPLKRFVLPLVMPDFFMGIFLFMYDFGYISQSQWSSNKSLFAGLMVAYIVLGYISMVIVRMKNHK